MGRAERLRQFLVRAERGDPVAIAVVALFIASIVIPILLGLWRYFNREREKE